MDLCKSGTFDGGPGVQRCAERRVCPGVSKPFRAERQPAFDCRNSQLRGESAVHAVWQQSGGSLSH